MNFKVWDTRTDRSRLVVNVKLYEISVGAYFGAKILNMAELNFNYTFLNCNISF